MDTTTDLRAALDFLTRRIEEEAVRTGDRLTEDQQLLLRELPKDSPLSGPNVGGPESPAYPIPRDPDFERLVSLVRSAYRHDLPDPTLSTQWEFSIAASKLSSHPMTWLLSWAGLKSPRPRADIWLLLAAALLLVVSTVVAGVLADVHPWSRFAWIAFGIGCLGVVIATYFASQRLENRRLKQIVNRSRRAKSGCL